MVILIPKIEALHSTIHRYFGPFGLGVPPTSGFLLNHKSPQSLEIG